MIYSWMRNRNTLEFIGIWEQLYEEIHAGTIKIKHPLMTEELIIVGFVVEDLYLNQEKFRILGGNSISYGDSVNSNIYSKIIIDDKKNLSKTYFQKDNEFTFRNQRGKKDFIKKSPNDEFYTEDSKRFMSNVPEEKISPLFNYYLYDKRDSKYPECAADVIYALCKYRKNDEFHYVLFDMFEYELNYEECNEESSK